MAGIGSIQPITQARAPKTMDGAGFTSSLELYISDIVGLITALAALFSLFILFWQLMNGLLLVEIAVKLKKPKTDLFGEH